MDTADWSGRVYRRGGAEGKTEEGRKEGVWIVIGFVVVLALLAWAGKRGTGRSSDTGMNRGVKNANRDHGYDGYR